MSFNPKTPVKRLQNFYQSNIKLALNFADGHNNTSIYNMAWAKFEASLMFDWQNHCVAMQMVVKFVSSCIIDDIQYTTELY